MNSAQPKPQTPIDLGDQTPSIECDVLIVGAGPAGLFLVFELGLLGIHAQVVDALPHAGGQAAELFGDKLIYDIPGTLACTGRELTERLLLQCKPFNPQFHLGQLVQTLDPQGDHFKVETDSGTRFVARAVVLASGVGAFLHRPLLANGLAPFLKTHIHNGPLYTIKLNWKSSLTSNLAHVWVVGGTQESVDDALELYEWGKTLEHQKLQVTLIHRRETLDASETSTKALQAAIHHSANSLDPCTLRFVHGQILHAHAHPKDPKILERVEWIDSEGVSQQSHCEAIIVDLGLSPQLGPIATWGLEMQKKQLPVNQEDYATSTPGIFAIGDIITYPGKKKLIVSGFHEATLAAYGIAKRVLNKDKIPFEYTSASALLHSRLGLTEPVSGSKAH